MVRWNPFIVFNGPTLYFVYGLSFFLLGFAIYIQPKRDSRLKLAQSLRLLATFAIIHGLAEWGYLFIPMIVGYFANNAIQGLEVIQRLLWIVSFVFLLCFGLSFFQLPTGKKLALWPIGVSVCLGILVLWLMDHNLVLWLDNKETEIISRYLLCIPGASLAAWGLYRQRDQLGMLGSKRLLYYLVLAIISFAGYALIGGLVVPEASFFPAKLINVQNFKDLFGFPVELARAGFGALMAVSILNLLRMFDLEDQKRLQEIARREALALDRERIARDLHDGVIQSIYAVGLTLQKLKMAGECGSQWSGQLDYVLKSLDGVVSDMRLYVQNLIPSERGDGLASTVSWLGESLTLPVELSATGRSMGGLSPQAANEVNLVIREAMSNVAKHAHATAAMVHFQVYDEGLEVQVKDNGNGLSNQQDISWVNRQKMGLKNIRARAAALNGTCNIDFTDQGTTVRILIPWEGNIIDGKVENTYS